jgi:hypothetical protein
LAIVGQSFAAQFEDKYAVFVHADRPPTDAEWSRVVAQYRQVPDPRRHRVLVYTAGGAPTAAQRADLVKVIGREQPRIAILTKSVIARVTAKAVSLFVPELRVFDAEQLEPALDYLELSGSDRAGARSTLDSLRKNVAMGGETRSLR